MKTKYNKILSVVVLAAVAAGITSCTLDSTEGTVAGNQQSSNVVLNIKTTGVDQVAPAITRSATVINDNYDSNDPNSPTSQEKLMQNLTIGLFKAASEAAGKTLDVKSVDITAGGEDASSATKTISTDYASTLTDADKPANGDVVRVALNMPASVITDLQSKTSGENPTWTKATESAFKNTQLTIDQALDMDGDGNVEPSELPMVGNSTMTFDTSEDQWESDITVHHLVAKVTLASLSVDFSATKHTSASFTPTEFFLTGVPDKINMDMSAGTYAFTQGAYSAYYQGESTVTGDSQKDYLGTGTGITAAVLNSSNTTYGSHYTLYTMPNNNETGNLTFLVIKGQYSSDGSTWNTKTVYYPICLGINTSFHVNANAHYVVNATIKGDGASSIDGLASLSKDNFATASPSTIQDLDVTVTVTDFDDESVTATFTNSGTISYLGLPDPVPGNLVFSDGTWGTLDMFPEKTPVAIVFSTNVSTTDYAAGYTHGYAIALKDAKNPANPDSYTMAWSTENVNIGTPLTLSNNTLSKSTGGLNLSSTDLQTAYRSSATYMDGRSETNLITSTTTNANYSQSKYPAAYAAVTTYESEVAHPAGTSGWYLPSIGQLWELVYAFGGLSDSDTREPRTQYCDFYWDGKASNVATAINNAAAGYLKNTAQTVNHSGLWTNFIWVSSGTSGYYWSSTESAYSNQGAGYAFVLYFTTDGNLYLDGSFTKSHTDRRVRPVLAF